MSMLLSKSTKERLCKLYMSIPLPLSKWLYAIARTTIFPDDRRHYFDMTFREIKDRKLTGDYLEFGVFQGSSFILAASLAEKHSLQAMRFFAFDSFEGLPENEGKLFRKGDYCCPEDRFIRMIKKAGVAVQKVIAVKGWYKQSLTSETKRKYQLNAAAVVHVDCDLYSSTVDLLAFLKDLVQPGTIIIFNDWHAFRNHEKPEDFGEERAFNEWPLRPAFRDFFESPATKAFIMTG